MAFVEEDLFLMRKAIKHIVLEISQRLYLVLKKFQGKCKGGKKERGKVK